MTSKNRTNPPTVDGMAQRGNVFIDAKTIDGHGVSMALTAARNGRAGVVGLYRGAWYPNCNLALRTNQQDLVPELERRGAALIAISRQRPDGSLSMQEMNEYRAGAEA